MNDTLTEVPYIEKPRKPVYAVKFTRWEQAEAILGLLGGVGFKLCYLLTNTPDPVPQLSIEVTMAHQSPEKTFIAEGDYLITNDPIEYGSVDAAALASGQKSRKWRVAPAEVFDITHERYRPR